MSVPGGDPARKFGETPEYNAAERDGNRRFDPQCHRMGTDTMQTAEGNWVNANWNGDRLNVNNWNDDANGNIGAASAWASSES